MKRPIRTLIVDDRDVARVTIKNSLIGYDCAFSEASTGAEALLLMAAQEFDVVFVDLRLPDISGIDLLAEARRRNDPIGVPIIYTGLPEATTPAEARNLGAKYLTKAPMKRAHIRAVFQDAIPGVVATTHSIVLPAKTIAVQTEEADGRTLRRLLVLDDNQNWLDIMEHVLGSEFELDMTTSPDTAMERAAADSYDLVILDMKLPEMSGLDVLKQMRQSAPDLRAIILTDHADLTLANESGRRGALDYVKKDRNTLAERVAEILSKNVQMTRVFFSYDHRDQKVVTDYYWKLTKRGFLPWMDDRNIAGGKDWQLTITEAVARSNRFVYFLSRNSFNRAGVMRGEINQALKRHEQMTKNSTFFIAARLEVCPVEKDIQQLEVVDLFKPDGFERLLEALTAN
jgi:CheY-like chemotaxis protein